MRTSSAFDAGISVRSGLVVAVFSHASSYRYLPGITLPSNVIANPDLKSAVKGATALIFVTPHQFIDSICEQLSGSIPKEGVRGITLVKVRPGRCTRTTDGVSCGLKG
jgi:glycerol-3-phosphate dehydrogenase